MSSVNREITQEGKKFRNRVLYDIFESINYGKFARLLHDKTMTQKEFLNQNIYKQIKDESIRFL